MTIYKLKIISVFFMNIPRGRNSARQLSNSCTKHTFKKPPAMNENKVSILKKLFSLGSVSISIFAPMKLTYSCEFCRRPKHHLNPNRTYCPFNYCSVESDSIIGASSDFAKRKRTSLLEKSISFRFQMGFHAK